MPTLRNLIGQRFGKLRPIKRGADHFYAGKAYITYLCDCDCGARDVPALACTLAGGFKKSCGCMKRGRARQAERRFMWSGELERVW